MAGFIRPSAIPPLAGGARAALAAALDAPTGLPPLRDLAAGKRVTLLLEDRTRTAPKELFAELLLGELAVARDVKIVIVTGSHEPRSAADHRLLEHALGAARRYALPASGRVHDCRHDAMVELGTTARGTPVRVSRFANDCDLFVAASDMKPHYFAGYSNAVKDFLPGFCSFATIEANHALALRPEAGFGRHPFHPDPARRTNPVAEDMAEGWRLILGPRPAFVLAAITDGEAVAWAGAGALEPVVAAGIREVDRRMARELKPERFAVVASGSYPLDESLYTAHPGLELVRAAVADGGEVLWLAECRDGLAPGAEAETFFFHPLRQPLPEVLAGIEREYHLYAHKAHRFATFLRTHRVGLHSTLPDDAVRSIHLDPAPDPQAVIARWLEQPGRIYLFDYANKLAVHPRPPAGSIPVSVMK